MDLKIKVCINDTCRVLVNDETEVGGKGYIPEISDNIVKYRFKYSDTASISVLRHNKIDEAVYSKPLFTEHKGKNPIEIPVEYDGWFDVFHIVLPTKEWLLKLIDSGNMSLLRLYEAVYFIDGNFVYKWINGDSTLVTILEVVERNSENTTISKISNTYVSICFLEKCYIALCKLIFELRALGRCLDKEKLDSELVFKRDLAWMALNVIKFLVKFNLLAEAERILEMMYGCNSICRGFLEKKKYTRGCGCGK